ncbi:MAG: alanine racemase [Spirochaetaceae bacterium]|nr:alanine racemase [Spirochaetaceae bacterium]
MTDRPAWAEVDLSAIAHNARQFTACIGPSCALCAVVKADGYGHGAVAAARAALDAGASYLAVAIASEGIELRAAGFSERLLVMGRTFKEQAARAAGHGLDLAVGSEEEARYLSDAGVETGTRVSAHLKIDTGMRRLGVPWTGAVALARRIASLPGLRLEGAFSHFASADDADLSFAREQLSRFLEAVASIEEAGLALSLRHIANSAGALALPEARLDMVRVGIALYGLAPSPEICGLADLRPAMRLAARVSALRDVAAGETVGYSRAWKAPRASRIATIPLGYADGWPRALSGRLPVAFAGGRAPIVGKICMDQFMVDATGLDSLRSGDEVTLFGRGGPSADEVAAALGTINYEVVCMIGKRVPRVYRDGARAV